MSTKSNPTSASTTASPASTPVLPPPIPTDALTREAQLRAELAQIEAEARAQRDALRADLTARLVEIETQRNALDAQLRDLRSKLAEINGVPMNGVRERASFARDSAGRDLRLPPAGTVIKNTKWGVSFEATTTDTQAVIANGVKFPSISAAARAQYAAQKGKDSQVDGYLAFGLK